MNWTNGKFGGFRFVGDAIIEEDYPSYESIKIFNDKFGRDGDWDKFWKQYNAKHEKAMKAAIEQHWSIQRG